MAAISKLRAPAPQESRRLAQAMSAYDIETHASEIIALDSSAAVGAALVKTIFFLADAAPRGGRCFSQAR